MPPAKPLRFVVGAGLTYGGEPSSPRRYNDGDEIEIDGGDGIVLLAGLDYRIDPQFSVQGTVAYHADRANAQQRRHAFRTRALRAARLLPCERQGARRRRPALRDEDVAARPMASAAIGDFDFKDTTSPVAEIEYLYSPRSASSCAT